MDADQRQVGPGRLFPACGQVRAGSPEPPPRPPLSITRHPGGQPGNASLVACRPRGVLGPTWGSLILQEWWVTQDSALSVSPAGDFAVWSLSSLSSGLEW